MGIAGRPFVQRGIDGRIGPVRPGFTLVELLVVIAVIAILVALLIPAVLQSRSAARKAECANNLKQLATAVQNYHGRMDSLPVYWGAMRSAPGEMFGGWLLHILPELDEQAFYDSMPRSGTATRPIFDWYDTGVTLPAVPPSADYDPGTWVTGTTLVTLAGGPVVEVVTSRLEGHRGTAGVPARPVWGLKQVGTAGITTGLPATFGQAQSVKSLGVLQCGDDPSPTPPNSMVNIPAVDTSGNPTTVPWSLTNYQANAHVFLTFSSPRVGFTPESGTMGYFYRDINGSDFRGFAGLFMPPRAQTGQGRDWGLGGFGNLFSHNLSGSASTRPRTLGHVTDGLSNTIMFAEGMRQCDGGAVFRFAFLPSGRATHEHSFGIEPSFTGTTATITTGTVFYGSLSPVNPIQPNLLFPAGNTIRFQSRPSVAMCNAFRVQGNHGPYLMTAMCDGSIRAISSGVSAREQVQPEASGREHYGTLFYSVTSRGGDLPPTKNPDGIWDMLMVPADPPQNVLSNTGEIGKERSY